MAERIKEGQPLPVSCTISGGTIYSYVYGWDGSAWQKINCTTSGADHYLDVQIKNTTVDVVITGQPISVSGNTGRTWVLDEVTDSVACKPTSYNQDLLNWSYIISRGSGSTITLDDSSLLILSQAYARDVDLTFKPLYNLSADPSIHQIPAAQPNCLFRHMNQSEPILNVSATDCVFHTLTINEFSVTGMAIAMTDGMGNTIGVITIPAPGVPGTVMLPVTLHYDIQCLDGLTIAVVSMSNFDLTISYVN
jgi:hypothetical protein